MKYTVTLRPAFTILEILVSVIILSVSIVNILKIHSANHAQIVYLSERNTYTLSDSLFLAREVTKHHKETRTAYDLIERNIKIKTLESRELLKQSERNISIPQVIVLTPPSDIGGPTSYVQEVKLKGKHSAIYWHFEIQP